MSYEDFVLGTDLRFRDSQQIEFFGEPERATEDSATVFDASLTYNLCKNTELFVRADNIFDTDYTEAGFKMPRSSVYGGIRLKLG